MDNRVQPASRAKGVEIRRTAPLRLGALLWLGGYLAFHAWEHWPVREGRDAVLTRLASTSHLALELSLVFVPLAAVAWLGALGMRRSAAERGYPGKSFFRFARLSGLSSLLLVTAHVATVWGARLRQEGRPAAAYARMVDQAGQLPVAALYVVFAALACTYWALEMGSFLAGAVSARRAQSLVWAACAGLSSLLWLVFVNELSAYAAGRALL